MKTKDLHDLTLAIIKGEKTDATQMEQNVAAAYVREIAYGSAEMTDSLHANSELDVIVKDVDGVLHVLTRDQRTFHPFESNEGEPWIGDHKMPSGKYFQEVLDDPDADVMTVEEAMNYQPSNALKP